MTSNGRVVWVLGAGFSQPLDAPTLENLFADWRLQDIANDLPVLAFDDVTLKNPIGLLRNVYEGNAGANPGKHPRPWRHPGA